MRSFLFVPADSERKLAKGPSSGPDGLILDLEDSVATDRKTIVSARPKTGQQRGVVIVEGIWPNRNFETGIGINAVTSAEPGWPNGGAVFHDTAVWIRKL